MEAETKREEKDEEKLVERVEELEKLVKKIEKVQKSLQEAVWHMYEDQRRKERTLWLIPLIMYVSVL